MRAVVQRVRSASVDVSSPRHHAAIERGLCVLLAVEHHDNDASARRMADRLARLRVFPDDDGRMNRSVIEVGGAVLLVSQFTLVGECSRGNRPSFVGAAAPPLASRLCGLVVEHLAGAHGLIVKTGVFGASMLVTIANDGPVTLILDSPSSAT